MIDDWSCLITDGGNCGDLDDIISDLCALEAELTDAQKEFHTKQPVTDGDSGNIDDMYSSNPQTMVGCCDAVTCIAACPSFVSSKWAKLS